MPRSHRYLLVLIIAWLLLVATVPVRAQDDDELPNTAWLTFDVDPHGAANVTLQVPVAPFDNRAELQRALADSFSLPMEFKDVVITQASAQPWTTIVAKNPNAFSRTGMTSTFRIDLNPLLTRLQRHNIEHLNVWGSFQNAPPDRNIEGAQRLPLDTGINVDRYEAYIDMRAPALRVINFSMGYTAGEITKKALPLILFLFLPAVWTTLHARRFRDRPAELWGRHLLFLNRLMNMVWLVWLPVYALSGMTNLVFFTLGTRDAAYFVSIAFYFVPPILALLLCDLASKEVYRLVPEIEWSRRDFVRQAITTTSFSLMPLFVAILAINTFSHNRLEAGGYVIASYVGWLLLNQTVRRMFAATMHELTGGELRTRIFDLGQKAGVLLQHIYVLPDNRAQLATAGARSDGSVVLTSSLVKNLSRREVDAIMAHEIAHQQARHPQTIGKITWGIVIGANLAGSFLAAKLHLRNSTVLVFAGALALSSLIVFFISRRNERQADAIGIDLTGDPEAFISGLARLTRMSLTPLHMGGWGASLDTHPGTMRRFEIIARAHGICDDRLQELLAHSDTSEVRYPSLDREEDAATIHSLVFKQKYRVRVALALFGVVSFSPLPFAFLLGKPGASHAIIAVAGVAFSFGVFQVVRNSISFWGYASLAHALKSKLKERGSEELARDGVVVGLAPASASRRYDGYPFWDAGVLWLTTDKLYYIGEQTEFALQRDCVTEVYTRNTAAEWFSEKSLFLQWKNESDTQTLQFVALGENSVRKARRAINSLKKRLDAWMYQCEDFPSASPDLESTAPAFPSIKSRPALTSFRFAQIVGVAIHWGMYGAAAGFLLRLSVLGICYIPVAIFLCGLLDEFPKTFMRVDGGMSETVPSDRTEERPNYQTGSWMTDEAS